MHLFWCTRHHHSTQLDIHFGFTREGNNFFCIGLVRGVFHRFQTTSHSACIFQSIANEFVLRFDSWPGQFSDADDASGLDARKTVRFTFSSFFIVSNDVFANAKFKKRKIFFIICLQILDWKNWIRPVNNNNFILLYLQLQVFHKLQIKWWNEEEEEEDG